MKRYTTLLFSVIICSGYLSAQVVMNGLVGFYPLNGDVNDYSGNGNNGVNKGATVAADRFGNSSGAYYFDGAGAFIEVAADPALEPDSFVSVSIWVKAEDYTTRQSPLCKRLFHNANPYNSYIITSTDVGPSQKWGFGVASSTAGTGVGATDPAAMTTTWTHIVGTYDGANVRLYINGALAATAAKTGLLGYTDSTLRIGLAIPGSSLQYFKGWIDDVRIYGRAITANEVSTLYSNTTDLLQNPGNDYPGVAFYPNPANTQITLVDAENILTARLFTMDGKEMKVELKENILSLSDLSAGSYILQTMNSDGTVRRSPLIIQR